MDDSSVLTCDGLCATYACCVVHPARLQSPHPLDFPLAQRLAAGHDLSFLIGGPDGHAPPVLARAQETWSLSRLTLPHALVRVVFIEQIYRAVTILDGHPYHRE